MKHIPDFTKPEINYFLENCNFTEDERTLFLLKNEEKSILECAEIMDTSKSTIDRLTKKIKDKMIRVL